MKFSPYLIGAFAAVAGMAVGAFFPRNDDADLKVQNLANENAVFQAQNTELAAKITALEVEVKDRDALQERVQDLQQQGAYNETIAMAQELGRRAGAFCSKPFPAEETFVVTHNFINIFDLYENEYSKGLDFLKTLVDNQIIVVVSHDDDALATLTVTDNHQKILKIQSLLILDRQVALQNFVAELKEKGFELQGQTAVLYEPIRNEGWKTAYLPKGESSFVEDRSRITINPQLCP